MPNQAASQFLAIAPRFFVADIQTASAYYRDILGFTIDRLWGDPPVFCMPHRDRMTIMLSEVADPTRIRPNGADGESWDAYFWVTDADALFLEFKTRGALVVHEPLYRPYYQNQEFAIQDPDGYILGFGHTAPRETPYG